jgi:hypothetical protein
MTQLKCFQTGKGWYKICEKSPYLRHFNLLNWQGKQLLFKTFLTMDKNFDITKEEKQFDFLKDFQFLNSLWKFRWLSLWFFFFLVVMWPLSFQSDKRCCWYIKNYSQPLLFTTSPQLIADTIQCRVSLELETARQPNQESKYLNFMPS